MSEQRSPGFQKALFSSTMFLSAFLLFILQPMIAKGMLPQLGGNAGVWAVCMLFFQTLLLAGYGYSHLLCGTCPPGRQPAVHLCTLLLGVVFLPLRIPVPGVENPSFSPVLYLLKALVLSVGYPYFLLSTTSPLLQKWFGELDHPESADPYFLFSSSNFGSVIALFSYPVIIEPFFSTHDQLRIWGALFLIFLGLVLVCGIARWRARGVSESGTVSEPVQIGPWKRAEWVLYSFLPSSLLLGVTTFVTSDLAPIPLLWVVPLSLYLGSFILVFSKPCTVNFPLLEMALFALLVPFIPLVSTEAPYPLWAIVPYHFAVFFLICILFHGWLSSERPPVQGLTEFYFWLSVGGVLGGLFNGVIAPFIFRALTEYPLMIGVAVLAVPIKWVRDMERSKIHLALYLSCGLNLTLFLLYYKVFTFSKNFLGNFLNLCLLACLYVTGFFLPGWFSLSTAVCFFMIALSTMSPQGVLFMDRSFYGSLQVFEQPPGQYRLLYHGSTNHGGQILAPGFQNKPFFYYFPEGPIGQVFNDLERRGKTFPVAVIGLGAGGLAPYARPGQEMVFYEIDPLVARVAADPRYFSYLSQSPGDVKVVVGDGRLELAKAPDHHFGLIILDAYSSDSIPFHLLTREAMELYLSKLTKDGLLAFHISHRYLKLEPVLGNLCRKMNLNGLTQKYDPGITPPQKKEEAPFVYNSRWVIVSKYKYNFGDLPQNDAWKALKEYPRMPAWTDSYSNLLWIYNWE